MPIPSLRAAIACAVLALVAGCAAAPSPIESTTWRDPAYNGPGFSRIFVVGLSAQSLRDQRGFENLLVSTLQGAGVGAQPGWQFVPTDRTPDRDTMRSAILQSGADAALLVRMSTPTTETDVVYSPGVVTAVAPNMYVGWYAPGAVSQDYQAATIYTTLFDVRTERPVWTWNPPTSSPGTFDQDAPAFAADVVARLRAAGLLAGR